MVCRSFSQMHRHIFLAQRVYKGKKHSLGKCMIASSYNTTCTRTRKVAETRHAARVFGPMKPTFWNVVSCRVTHGASPCSLARHTRAGQHRGSPFALRAAARCQRATFKDKCASVRKAEQEPSVYKEEQEGERERNRETERQRDRERLM